MSDQYWTKIKAQVQYLKVNENIGPILDLGSVNVGPTSARILNIPLNLG